MDLADHAQTYIPRLVLSPSISQKNFFELSVTQESGKGGVRTDSCPKQPLVLEFCATISATGIVGDVSMCQDTQTWDVSAVMESCEGVCCLSSASG